MIKTFDNEIIAYQNWVEINALACFAIVGRVSVQGVESLGGHFATLCREFDYYEVKKKILFFKKKRGILLHF